MHCFLIHTYCTILRLRHICSYTWGRGGAGAPGRHRPALSTELSQMKIRKKRSKRARERGKIGEEWVGRRSGSARGRVALGPHGAARGQGTLGAGQAGRASGVLDPPAHATTNTALHRAGWGRCHARPSPTVDLQGGGHLEPTDTQPRVPRRPSTIGPMCA